MKKIDTMSQYTVKYSDGENGQLKTKTCHTYTILF